MDLDPVGLVESAYGRFGSQMEWLTAMAPGIVGHFDPDRSGALAYFHGPTGPQLPVFVPCENGRLSGEKAAEVLRTSYRVGTSEQLERVALAVRTPGMVTMVETIGHVVEPAVEASGFAARDSPAVMAPTASGTTAVFASLTTAPYAVTDEERDVWQRIGLHLAAACRLVGRPVNTEADDVEVVLSEFGDVLHVRDSDGDVDAGIDSYGAIADATRNRSPVPDALSLWPALLAGRWTPVKFVDTDGKRLVLLRRNDPDAPLPGSLTRRQRQVAFYASLGWSLKRIGYALGLRPSAVSNHLARVREKLGLTHRTELIRFVTQLSLVPPSSGCAALTPSELDVAHRASRGASNRDIADARGSSARTVANQLASVYDKLGVTSRHELAVLMSGSETETRRG